MAQFSNRGETSLVRGRTPIDPPYCPKHAFFENRTRLPKKFGKNLRRQGPSDLGKLHPLCRQQLRETKRDRWGLARWKKNMALHGNWLRPASGPVILKGQ
jgi:hypothetical protein